MVLSVKHTFTSPKADGTDSTLIQPSNWNAEHTITLAAGKILGRDSSGSGAVQELSLSFDPTQQSMIPPTGTTAQRPATAAAGMLRYNTDLAKVELYNGTSWGSVGGGAAISDTGPANPQPGDLWWKSDEGQLYVYYNDGTSSQWVIANAFMGGTAFGDITVTSINAGPLAGTRNRIINGAMEIDQRNNGAAVANSGSYTVDRWADSYIGSGRYTAQRSTVAPTGFTNSLLHTVSTAVSPAATDVYQILQAIEAVNIADFAWGGSAAKTVTLSFWVRSSVAGSYSLKLSNGPTINRSYVTTYTINAANTWEYKTVTIPGDTSGTWVSDNTAGLFLCFDLGCGSNFNTGSLNTWQAGNFYRAAGTVNLISNNGATFYVTGVQLEVGSQATPFERRNYQQELAMCQRYYWRVSHPFFSSNYAPYTTNAQLSEVIACPVDMRATPTTSINTTGMNISGIGSPGSSAMSRRSIKIGAVSTTATTNAYFTSVSGNFFDASAEL
jgi:hypothetical protein